MGQQDTTAEVLRLVDEVRLLFHQLVTVGEQLHRDDGISMGMRAVLERLLLDGAATVPDIARSRGVTRQHIQTLVNELLESDAVELVDNPAHKRSKLVTLTSHGRQVIQKMKTREAKFFRALKGSPSSADLRRASETLRTMRQSLGGTP